MKKHKRTAVFLVIAVVMAGVLGGCSEVQSENIIMEEEQVATEEEVVLTFLGYKADALNLIAIEKALHGFMDLHKGINVVYEGVKGTAYWDVLNKRSVSDNLNDIIMVDHDHMIDLIEENKLADLSDLSTIDTFAPMAKSQFTEPDGSVYFLPTCISTFGLYVNLDLLKEHGQDVPENFSEFTEVCDYFVSQGITPIVANNFSSLRNLIIAKSMYPIYQKEDPDAEIAKFNSGEADLLETLRPGVEMAAMMIERGWFDCEEVLVTEQTSDDLAIFAEGERPFMVTGGWASMRVEDMNPGLTFKVYPFPVLDNGSVLVMDVNTCISVRADSENLEYAKELVEYITQMDVMWEYCDSQDSFTPLKDDRVPSSKTIEPCAEYLMNGQNVIGSNYNLELHLDAALVECGTGMLNGDDADRAMERLSELLTPEKDLQDSLQNDKGVNG